MRSRWISAVLFALLSLFVVQAWAQQGYTIREVEVKQEPFTDAATLATLPEKAIVTITKRQGGWMQITSAQANGWIRMLSVRLGEPGGSASTKSSSSGGSWFASLFSLGRSSSSGAAVTTGVRGLDKEQITNATPNFAEVQKMQSYTVSKDKAQQFAGSDPRLGTQSIDYLGKPSGSFGSSGESTPPPGSSPFSN